MRRKSRLKEIRRVRKIKDEFYKSHNTGRDRRLLLSMPDVVSVSTMGGWTFRAEMQMSDGSEFYESGDSALSKLMQITYRMWITKITKDAKK